jgi:Protein of unknown function (DUF541)
MFSTKPAALAIAACLAGALASGAVAAQADSSATPPAGATGATGATAVPATITINGSGSLTLDAGASTGDVSSGYLSALTAALGDAHTKAAALSAAVGDTLGAVENVTEQSTDDGLCSGPVFMNAAGAPAAAPATSKPGKHAHHKAKPSHKVARIADVAQTSCTVTADVTVTWAMSPS